MAVARVAARHPGDPVGGTRQPMGGDRDRRQGGGAHRPRQAQPGRRRSWSSSIRARRSPTSPIVSTTAGVVARALRRESERAGEGRGDRRVSRPCERPSVHAVRRRRAQHPVLQHADQFRRAVEPDGDRAAHRPHRPHRPEPRGLRLQSGHARHAWRSSCWRCSMKRSRCSSWSSARSAPSSAASKRSASSPIWCWTPGWGRPRQRRSKPSMRLASGSSRRARQHEDAKALDEKLFGEDFEAA